MPESCLSDDPTLDIPTEKDCDDSDPEKYLLSTSGRCMRADSCCCDVYEGSLVAHEANGRVYSQEESCGWNCTETVYYATGSNENLGTDSGGTVTLYSNDEGTTRSTTEC